MFEHKHGSKSSSICAVCDKKVPATLKNETISLCEGLEEIEDVLIVVCDECGNICSIPYKSIEPIQDASDRLLESNAVSRYGEIALELKSQVEARRDSESKSELDNQHEYSLQVTG